MILSIDEGATYTSGGTDYKLAGLYFKPVSDIGVYNDCMTDFEYNPIAYIPNIKLNTSFSKQPKLTVKVVPKYNVAYKAFSKGIWRISDLKYETIEEFIEACPNATPCHLLVDGL